MKTMFRFVISSLLAVTILLSGSSFTFGKMVCLETGYTIIDYKKVEDCCDRQTAEPSIYPAECCEITNVDLAVDHFVNTKTDLVKVAVAPIALHAIPGLAVPVPAITDARPLLLVQPPPEPQSELLHSIRQYRI